MLEAISSSRLYEAFQVGRASQKIAAYHGTSLDILQEILRTGRQTGTDVEIIRPEVHLCVRTGDVFVFPINGRTDVKSFRDLYAEPEAFFAAEIYANILAGTHYLMKKLDLSKYSTHHSDISALSDLVISYNPRLSVKGQLFPMEITRAEGVVNKAGYTLGLIRKWVEQAKTKKGCIIGYSDEALKMGNPLPGNDGHDMRIQGVTIDSIIGLEPLDNEVFHFLERLMGHSRD